MVVVNIMAVIKYSLLPWQRRDLSKFHCKFKPHHTKRNYFQRYLETKSEFFGCHGNTNRLYCRVWTVTQGTDVSRLVVLSKLRCFVGRVVRVVRLN